MNNAPPTRLWPFLLIALVLLCDPVLANKFETIGSGVAGSFRLKREFLQVAFLVGGGVFLLSSLLAVVLPHTNAAFLNYRNWKTSAVILAILGVGMLSAYLLV